MRAYVIGAAAALAALAGLYVAYGQLGGGTAGQPSATQAGNTATTAIASDFAFRRLEIDTSKPQAEACLVFTRALDTSGATHYEDYLAATPAARIAVRANDERLCIGGLAFNATYSVQLKPGLPDAKGAKLDPGETVQVELRDRPALVRFSGGILLPRENAEGVPVTTVNISKLKLKVLRVGDRLLTQLETDIVDESKLFRYDQTRLEENQASLVWNGEMDVANSKNDVVTTLVPIRDILRTRAPGAYLILASDANAPPPENDYSGEVAAQWVIDSDIGLTSFMGGQSQQGRGQTQAGLSVFARAFSDARPLSGIRLTLIARNNNVLQEATTDSSGRADFDPGFFRGASATSVGGEEPVAVMAYGANGDYTFLDLRRPVFDLTDRGVGGRAAPGPVDAYLYTERGVYRPGETIHSVTAFRDSTGHAISAPVTLVAFRPDGVEFRRIAVPAANLMAGNAHWPLALTASAPQGRWSIAAYLDPSAAPVGRVAFDVADFVPQRLKLTLAPQEKFLTPKGDFTIRVESRFLYGAPASGLTGEGEARLTKDSDPFPAYPKYRWGRDNEKFEDALVMLEVPVTDAAGVTAAKGNTGELPDLSLPLKADVKISIDEPGGRATTDELSLPIRSRDVWLGLRSDFDDSVKENSKAGFEAIAVNGAGERIAVSGLHYEFVREETYYTWFQEMGEWKFNADIRSRIVSGGAFDIATDKPAALAQTLRYGRYRLTVSDPMSGASTSVGFWSGWAGSNAGDRPDRVAVQSDKEKYKPGETAHIAIAPQSDGRALVVVAGDKLYDSKLIDVPASGGRIDIPVSADWGAGAYVMVTHYRPLRDVAGHAPVRSVGLVWLGIDNAARTLTAELGAPQVTTPRQTVTVPISVQGLDTNEEAYVTLAAVDEGILQLTDFKSPDPAAYYFGKRRLGIGMHDDYGRLINPEKAPLGVIRSGGDGFGGRPLAVVPTITVALFSGLVKLANGKAEIPVAIPDFNGELRLMAVVTSKDKMGAAAKPMTVRDAVVGDVVLPRFLAPGDVADATLNLNNVEGAAGAYTAVLRAMGAATVPGVAADTTIARDLAVGQRVLTHFPLRGVEPGIATLSLDLSGPGGFKVSRSWQIEVRPAQLPVSRNEIAVIQPGQSWSATSALTAGLVPSTARVALTVSATRSYSDVVGMLRWLDKYPLGCLEQTTSRAMPLLVFNDLASQADLPQDANLRPRIQDAVDRVLDMQGNSGGFGLWSSSGDPEPFLSVFAMDFLYQSKAKNYVVPEDGLRRGARFLQSAASTDSNDEATRAYAFYLLSREGLVNLSDMRYFADVKLDMMKTAIAPALMGDALSLAGDKARASASFTRARTLALAGAPGQYMSNDHYGSLLRDVAGVTALAVEGGQPELVPALLRRSDALNMNLNATTTQEKAWMLRAAYELSKARAPLAIAVDSQTTEPKSGAVRLAPSMEDLQRGLKIDNQGQAPVWRNVSVEGQASAPLRAEAVGLTLQKTVWTPAGRPADLNTLKQNDRVVVVLQGKMPNNLYRQMAAIDLLPAGLEIETTLSGEEGKIYPFLGKLTETNIAEARDDRFVASFDIGARFRPVDNKRPEPQPEFKLAYVARVVTAGKFAMPAGVVEDMYAATVHARTEMSTMTSAAAQ